MPTIKFAEFMILIALLKKFGSKEFVTIIEVGNMRSSSGKANKLYIYTIRGTLRDIAIKERKIYNIKIKIIPLIIYFCRGVGLFATYLFATHTLSRPDLFAPYTFATCTRSLPDIFASCSFRYPDYLSQNNRYMKEVILFFILYFIYLKIFTIYI